MTRTISIHAPHEGERPPHRALTGSGILDFNPRSPRGGATSTSRGQTPCRRISIHAPHEGERRILSASVHLPKVISIHAPHEGERPR